MSTAKPQRKRMRRHAVIQGPARRVGGCCLKSPPIRIIPAPSAPLPTPDARGFPYQLIVTTSGALTSMTSPFWSSRAVAT
jgi:hypothetical protein